MDLDMAFLFTVSAAQVSTKECMDDGFDIRFVCVVRYEPHSATVVEYAVNTVYHSGCADQRDDIDHCNRYAPVIDGKTLRIREVTRLNSTRAGNHSLLILFP
jgi:hypothetical protein